MPILTSHRGHTPRVAQSAYLAETAVLVGDVEVGEGASVWYGAVLRGDMGQIRVGARTNIQDLAMVHMTEGMSHALIGEDVTVGHSAIIHGATIGPRCLIGMGAIILDNAEIGADVLIGAGALVTPRTVIPPGVLVLGTPGKVVRELSPEERAHHLLSAAHYVELARGYRG